MRRFIDVVWMTALGLTLVCVGASASPLAREIVCAGQPVPSGWLVIERRWSATRCGDGSPSAPNQEIIEHVAGRAVGARVQVCIDAPTPAGWVEIERSWRATSRCTPHGSPTSPNVKTIKRLQ